MGDFNINLLYYESHAATECFVNTMFTYNLLPKIIKPTRITSHSATLIDNIFINSLGYHSISGNTGIFSDLTTIYQIFLSIKVIVKFLKQIFLREIILTLIKHL